MCLLLALVMCNWSLMTPVMVLLAGIPRCRRCQHDSIDQPVHVLPMMLPGLHSVPSYQPVACFLTRQPHTGDLDLLIATRHT
jgi:hypothetical protein